MTHSASRARVAIGSSIVAVAIGTALVAQSASSSAPPSEPPTSEPAGSAPAAGDREALVDAIVASGELALLPLNRECVAGSVEHLPDEDVAPLVAQIEAEIAAGEAATNTTIPDITVPDLGDVSIPEMPDTSAVPGSITPETAALGEEIIGCVEGTADPTLVERAVELAEAQYPPAGLDLECASTMFSTFPDELLQQILDSGQVNAGGPTASTGDNDLGHLVKLLACADLGTATPSTEATATTPSSGADAAAVPATTAASASASAHDLG